MGENRFSKAGFASAAALTPEQRKARASAGHLAGSVATVIKRMEELTEDQRQALRAALDRA